MKKLILPIILLLSLASCGGRETRTISLPSLPDGTHTVTIDDLNGAQPIITIEE